MKKYLLILTATLTLLAISLILLVISVIVSNRLYVIEDLARSATNLLRDEDSQTKKPLTLTYWGLFVPNQVMEPLISDYVEKNPHVKVNYDQKLYSNDLDAYRRTLKTRLKEGQGPSIYRIHSSWISSLFSEISQENKFINKELLEKRFHKIAINQTMSSNGNIYAIPLMHDGLVMLYDLDEFAKNNIELPKTWEDLRIAALTLSRYSDGTGRRRQILLSGVALGTANNVTNFSDIIGLMLVQSGVKIPSKLDSSKSETVFRAYTKYALDDNTWSSNMPESILAFAAGDTAIVFAKTADIERLLEINPSKNFGVAAVPQLPMQNGEITNINWASLFVDTVSNDLTEYEQQEAWRFLVWLSGEDQQQKLYNEMSKYKKAPYLPANKNAEIASKYLDILSESADSAVSYRLTSSSGNNGYVKIIAGVVDSFHSSSLHSLGKILIEAKNSYKRLVDRE